MTVQRRFRYGGFRGPFMMTNSGILTVSKNLLESRAFTKRELKGVLYNLIGIYVLLKNMRMVSELMPL